MDIERAGIGQADETRRGDWILIASGRRFWPLDPREEEIEIEDIAVSLAKQCRFSGHCREFYSVAQHCIFVSRICKPEDALWGLLHDASEAYLCDVPRPVKQDHEMRFYRNAEIRLDRLVRNRFEVPETSGPDVLLADSIALRTEARDLMGDPKDWVWPEGISPLPIKIVGQSWNVAEVNFLRRFHELRQ